mmetsp:Transcript_95848/g.276819  ORF Transcript_95848/g.276819 Transcript_95848/m.276819 type:complete len:385 (+) Transcript_95848:2537-3691(+)
MRFMAMKDLVLLTPAVACLAASSKRCVMDLSVAGSWPASAASSCSASRSAARCSNCSVSAICLSTSETMLCAKKLPCFSFFVAMAASNNSCRSFSFDNNRVDSSSSTVASASAALTAFLIAKFAAFSAWSAFFTSTAVTVCVTSSSTACLARPTFSSAAFACSAALRIFVSSSSLVPVTRCHLVTSACWALTRALSFKRTPAASAEVPVRLLASTCRSWTKVRALASATAALPSALEASPFSRFAATGGNASIWAVSSNGCATSPSCFVNCSKFDTRTSASRNSATRFRSAVLLFKSFKRLMCTSSWVCNCFNLAEKSWDKLGDNRLASTSFVMMNILVVEAAVLAVAAEASQSRKAVKVSSKGNSSTPNKKGPSASAALETAS